MDFALQIQPEIISCTSSPRAYHNIVVFGGSMTGGGQCKEGIREKKECAWPARFQRWLTASYGGCIQVHNFARGGTQTEVALSMIPVMLNNFAKSHGQPDLVITDFSVNDVYELDGNVGRQSVLRDDGGMFTVQEKGAAIAELLILTVRNLTRDTSKIRHWIILSHHPKVFEDSGLLNSFARMARLHGVAVLDTRQLWPNYWFPVDTHPDFRTHELLAELLVSGFCTALGMQRPIRNILETAGLPQFSLETLRERLPSCTNPVTVHSAYEQYKHAPDDVGDWKLIEDRKGKPGWISTVTNSSLVLPLTFGATPLLVVNYLRSYEGVGCANLSINGVDVILSGPWTKNISTTATFYSQAYANTIQSSPGDDNYGIIGFGIQPYTQHNAIFTLTTCPEQETVPGKPNKFKLIEVVTC